MSVSTPELYPDEPRRWSTEIISGDEISELRLTSDCATPGLSYLVIFKQDDPPGAERKAYSLTADKLRELARGFAREADILDRENGVT